MEMDPVLCWKYHLKLTAQFTPESTAHFSPVLTAQYDRIIYLINIELGIENPEEL